MKNELFNIHVETEKVLKGMSSSVEGRIAVLQQNNHYNYTRIKLFAFAPNTRQNLDNCMFSTPRGIMKTDT